MPRVTLGEILQERLNLSCWVRERNALNAAAFDPNALGFVVWIGRSIIPIYIYARTVNTAIVHSNYKMKLFISLPFEPWNENQTAEHIEARHYS